MNDERQLRTPATSRWSIAAAALLLVLLLLLLLLLLAHTREALLHVGHAGALPPSRGDTRVGARHGLAQGGRRRLAGPLLLHLLQSPLQQHAAAPPPVTLGLQSPRDRPLDVAPRAGPRCLQLVARSSLMVAAICLHQPHDLPSGGAVGGPRAGRGAEHCGEKPGPCLGTGEGGGGGTSHCCRSRNSLWAVMDGQHTHVSCISASLMIKAGLRRQGPFPQLLRSIIKVLDAFVWFQSGVLLRQYSRG